MKSVLKKFTYFILLPVLITLIALSYCLFFPSEKPTDPTHLSISLQPVTVKEQQDLIIAQEQTEGVLERGPLVLEMNATDAQARILNLSKNKN
ncbi:MAG: hypothetical protein ACD_42C00014G0007 [uncultured bacterium]|nr:MAG: hypothetical protein ACD_42C00014G0007 [uncultured bacterium]OGT32996.1 MAG: hypothetical protein A3C44_06605 [Gammaproteobacteria bacterium RIFCSPHIGHO2_02_FULL_39_13]OGT49774.1 MAG: hypothetical protein A3E53_04740 [Gammaproteobacteria bacterium RIFCSPHIGHO2_12_FULL_39_24]